MSQGLRSVHASDVIRKTVSQLDIRKNDDERIVFYTAGKHASCAERYRLCFMSCEVIRLAEIYIILLHVTTHGHWNEKE